MLLLPLLLPLLLSCIRAAFALDAAEASGAMGQRWAVVDHIGMTAPPCTHHPYHFLGRYTSPGQKLRTGPSLASVRCWWVF
jgi:hypothetical protein